MFITLGIAPRDGRAADPQPYRTSLAKTGDASLDAALSGSSGLVGLQKTNAVGPFALAGRIRADYDRLRTALACSPIRSRAENSCSRAARTNDSSKTTDRYSSSPPLGRPSGVPSGGSPRPVILSG